MSTKLTYPPLPDGYRWNLLNKINMKIGKWPGTTTTGNATHISFIEDLTPQEIADVNAIMADPNTAQNPVEFTEPDNRYVLKDIEVYREQLETAVGFQVAISYKSSGTFGANVYDEIVLQPVTPDYQEELVLTNPQKNTMANTIKSQMGGWE
jgi:hypothetical protein